ncbi:hypothetical protein QTN47_19510 [Danxiaibacter flavus]|uniref:DUF4760 domain-containing protein n=1 Tax=Danxiaibacter flavus TaxID=3049108 RepID=A0ABV3ZIJ9_9BACT|nr:hypothetical protein QNM32_19520 [Chitinophagaceae bacterium DXS]
MTRKQLKRTIIAVITLYAIALFGGLIIYFRDETEKKINYQVFKDLIPLIIAIPAAYLGFCFQRRSSFLQSLRLLWTNIIGSVNAAIQYTNFTETTDKQYCEILLQLSRCIDEVRGVYKNLGEKKNEIGYYPFECLKEIHKLVSELGYGKLDATKSKDARERIKHCWKDLKVSFLSEFDRSEPTVFNSPFV